MMTSQLTSQYLGTSKYKRGDYDKDIAVLVDEFSEDYLFNKIPSRSHKSYHSYVHAIHIDNRNKLQNRMEKYSTNLGDELQKCLPKACYFFLTNLFNQILQSRLGIG